MKKNYLMIWMCAIMLGTFFNAGMAKAQILAWQFYDPATTGKETTIGANIISPNLNASELKRGEGLNTNPGLGKSFAWGADVSSSKTLSDTTKAIDNDLYVEFSISAKTGYKFSLSTLDYKLRASAGGAGIWYWKYSVDGTIFNKVTDPLVWTGGGGTGTDHPQISLSSIAALQNVEEGTTVYFRLYVAGSNTGTGSSAFGQSNAIDQRGLAIGGIVEEIEENPLPIKLSSFSGKASLNSVKLNWETQSEENNSHFEILKLNELGKSVVLGTVSGSGNSSTLKTYTYEDYSPTSGNNYYQLRQIDYNGESTLSKIISIKFGLGKSNFEVAALDDKVVLYLKGTSSSKTIVSINNIEGKSLYKRSIAISANQDKLELPIELKSGVYVVVLNIDGQNFAKKLVKP